MRAVAAPDITNVRFIAAAGPPAASLALMLALCLNAGVDRADVALCAVAGVACLWVLRPLIASQRFGEPPLAAAVAFAVAATACLAGVMFVAAAAWGTASVLWLRPRLRPDIAPHAAKWAPAAAMLVPWVWADGEWIGWQMRMSGAAAAGECLSLVSSEVAVRGTTVSVGGLHLDVAAACAGLSTLQLFLAGGLVAAACRQKTVIGVLAWLPAIVAFAWVANVARVVALGSVAVVDPGWVTDATHDALSWLTVATAAAIAAAALPRPEVAA